MLPGGQISEALKITRRGDQFISFQTSYRSAHETWTTDSTLRFPSREQVEALLVRSGLVARHLFGDWDASPFDISRSKEMIFLTEIAVEGIDHD